MNYLKKYGYSYRWLIFGALAMKVIATLLTLVLPWAFTYMINEIVPQKSYKMLLLFGSFMVGIAVVTMLMNIVTGKISTNLTVSLSKKMREDVFTKIAYLECEQVDELAISSLITRLTTDIANIQQFVSKMLTKGIATPILLFGSIIAASFIDRKLTVIMLITVPLIAWCLYITSKLSFKNFQKTKIANDKLVKSIRENIMGIRVIKALSKNDYESNRFEEVNKDFTQKNKQAEMVNVVGSPTTKFILNVGMVLTLAFGAYWVSEGTSNAASIIAFMSYFTNVLTSLMGISQMVTAFSRSATAVKRIEEVLGVETITYEQPVQQEQSKSFIEFRNVSFSYGTSKQILKNISFTLEKNQTLGLIGVTAAGKSSIVHLLLRLYQPDEGEIFINGENINRYSSETLFELFGVVFQSDILFNESVTENIVFGRGVSKQAIEDAVESAQAKHFIEHLPQQYDSKINIRGQNISGGEKQRVLIARALVANPKILVLDDSSNALDYKTDAKLRKDLSMNYPNTTKVIVSQRIATIMNADKIVVLDKGTIVATGKHESLYETSKLYKEITDLQLSSDKKYA